MNAVIMIGIPFSFHALELEMHGSVTCFFVLASAID